jgi:antirestriction factor ArdC-like protein
MIEQIKQINRGQFNVEGSLQVRTGDAPTGAERKPMVSWAGLLDESVKNPGFIQEAYSRFHNYSLGNQLLALFQCFMSGIQPGPLATFPKWKELGRHVKNGEKALTICMPLTCKRTKTVKEDDGTDQEEEFSFTHFTYKAHWFVLAQTEGAEYQSPTIPEWSEERALAALDIERVPFKDLDGNTQGYAKRGRNIAVSPTHLPLRRPNPSRRLPRQVRPAQERRLANLQLASPRRGSPNMIPRVYTWLRVEVAPRLEAGGLRAVGRYSCAQGAA